MRRRHLFLLVPKIFVVQFNMPIILKVSCLAHLIQTKTNKILNVSGPRKKTHNFQKKLQVLFKREFQ